jgi:DNA-directed RNA polymerase specialized sigma24 family protein
VFGDVFHHETQIAGNAGPDTNGPPAVDKAIILLHLGDQSYDEIASITGLSKTNVSVRLVRIKRALKDRIEESMNRKKDHE